MRFSTLLSVTVQNNKKKYLRYNEWRKKQFLSNTPKDAHIILHLLPWLLTVNDVHVPGYIKEIKHGFKVFNIENNRDILFSEGSFKKKFGFQDERFTVRYLPGASRIEGIYTIGSVGTISQTLHSDCDIWICINQDQFEKKSLDYLNQKINLIKGWLDEQIRIPVFFFLTDIADIQKCNFGNIDFESSGSTQKNVLKEEFYRTSILICGKIPFWWVTYDPEGSVDYAEELNRNAKSGFGDTDFIDLGNLTQVEKSEYYGASLWQLNKALTHPLKSIIKMLMLKMFLESSSEELLCNGFRKLVLNSDDKSLSPDPSLFTMQQVLAYYAMHDRQGHFEFIKKCFYLRYELKMMSKKQTEKEEMAASVFSQYKIDRNEIYELNEFESWDLARQTEFGGLLFEYITDIYRDILRIQKGMRGEVAQEDMLIIGRKLSSSRAVKNFKVPVLHMPSDKINLSVLTFMYTEDIWQVYSHQNPSETVIANEEMVFCLAYLVWNGIFDPLQTRMQPNPTSVTLQEIINVAKMMLHVFGIYDISRVHFSNFLNEESITKMLILISFDEKNAGIDIQNISIIYKNNWEELFVRRFSSLDKMKAFFSRIGKGSPRIETHYYIQRSNKYFEKIIDRLKNIIDQMIQGA